MPPTRKHALTNKDKIIRYDSSCKICTKGTLTATFPSFEGEWGQRKWQMLLYKLYQYAIGCLSKQLTLPMIFEAKAQNSAFGCLSTVL